MIKRAPADYPDLGEVQEDSEEDELSLTFMHCLGGEEPLPRENFVNTFQGDISRLTSHWSSSFSLLRSHWSRAS